MKKILLVILHNILLYIQKSIKKSLLWVTDRYVELQNLSILSTPLYSHDAM